MPAQAEPHHRRAATPWLVFMLLVALPSILLAGLGLRAISADDAERADQARRNAEAAFGLVDEALRAALERARVAKSPVNLAGSVHVERHANGALSFPADRVFVAGYGIPVPGEDEAGRIPGEIVESIRVVRKKGPVSPEVQRILRSSRERLRAGTWWLHLDQRRAYDRELTDGLQKAGDVSVNQPDRRVALLLVAHNAIMRAGHAPGARAVNTDAGPGVLVWPSPHDLHPAPRGLYLTVEACASILDGVAPVLETQRLPARVKGPAGEVLWTSVPDGRRVDFARPLDAVDGWSLELASSLPVPASRPLRAYGQVLLPMMVLMLGLGMTWRLMRHELALARRQREFTAAVTHEFKTPITSLRLVMERISAGRVTDPESLREYHATIERETERLDRLVTRVLTTQADAAGHNRPVRAATPVRELIDAALSRVRTQAVERRIDVEVTAEPGVPEIFVDRERLADAIANLVENAIKFSPSGRRVAVSIAKSDRHISIAVRDQGAGIAPGELRRIFEPYYRGALGDQENVRGTGLGLALVHTTVEAHGGRIDVVSAPAQGSTFTIYLPLGGPA